MKFANPYLLNLLWGLIPLFGIMSYGILKQKKILSGFAGAGMLSLIVPGFDPKRRWIKAVLLILAFGFAIIALSGPQLGYKWEKTTQKGVDIMIALDCSKSMLARDIKPNRLERAKREIIDLLHMMKSDRAGLVAFSGRAILQCPLTLDHEAFNIFLKVLKPGFLPVGGTNLEAAIKTSYEGFEKKSDTKKAIIIITDGESTSGDVEETAKLMAKKGIKIFSIGVGNLQGAPIPDENGGFKKDGAGNIIMSKVDEKALEKLAAVTGGIYVRSVAGDMDLDLIYKDRILGTMERKTLTSGKRKVWENRYQWFLFPALVLLLMEFMLPSKKRINKLFVLALGVAMLFFQNQPVYAKSVSLSVKKGIKAFDRQNYENAKKHFIDAQLENPENAKLYYDIGAAAYMNKEYDQAKKNFTQALKSDDASLRHDARYNLANTYYRMGNLGEAIKEYENILKKFPGDKQAKENLKFVKKQKKKKQKKKKESKTGKDKNNKKNKKDRNKNSKQNKQKQHRDKKTQGNKNKDKPEQEKLKPRENKKAALKEKQTGQANKILENKLNRLEDKPGSGMMPLLQEQHVEKDW
ncbi:MAG: VWA domain-containing protein [Deltaproteobacteria bacterium]|nr:VWA domain-containing protein [Deltaproteobacteria bacterium]